MWDSYQGRVTKKRADAKAQRDAKKSLLSRLRLPGVPATVKYAAVDADPVILEGVLSLADLNPLGMTLFLEAQLVPGSDVSVTLEQPRQFYVRGGIVSCHNYLADSKVIFERPLAFRCAVKFKFDSPEEAEEVRKYCEYIYAEVLHRAG